MRLLWLADRPLLRQAFRRLRSDHRRSHHISSAVVDHLVSRPVQSYISTSDDPCLNLSIEHHLLQNSPPESVLLFLYVNRPCVVIGRNQNPWLEVNLPYLRELENTSHQTDLVRRRSGGGTVFHDHGNVNWTVICPPKIFTRDRHVELVVRALRECGADRARVNERHDVVLDQGQQFDSQVDSHDTHRTPYGNINSRPLKVSGSAYKLTRNGALHHGTCLLSSPNLGRISNYLRSPIKQNITAKGVESVSSPVDNIGISVDDFIRSMRNEFAMLYSRERPILPVDQVGEDWLVVEKIREGVAELKSLSWTFDQTPQFTINKTIPTTLGTATLELDVRSGSIATSRLTLSDPSGRMDRIEHPVSAQSLRGIRDWSHAFRESDALPADQLLHLGDLIAWLNMHLPGLSR